jgi:hypothetical protein
MITQKICEHINNNKLVFVSEVGLNILLLPCQAVNDFRWLSLVACSRARELSRPMGQFPIHPSFRGTIDGRPNSREEIAVRNVS